MISLTEFWVHSLSIFGNFEMPTMLLFIHMSLWVSSLSFTPSSSLYKIIIVIALLLYTSLQALVPSHSSHYPLLLMSLSKWRSIIEEIPSFPSSTTTPFVYYKHVPLLVSQLTTTSISIMRVIHLYHQVCHYLNLNLPLLYQLALLTCSNLTPPTFDIFPSADPHKTPPTPHQLENGHFRPLHFPPCPQMHSLNDELRRTPQFSTPQYVYECIGLPSLHVTWIVATTQHPRTRSLFHLLFPRNNFAVWYLCYSMPNSK